jgi:hypothetical protein|tara:strand:- start:1242 stop:1505 length:264 start_codon:yes stop_codon:yes gene_type:complete
MAKRPKNRKVDRSMLDQGGVTPLRALTAALLNRRENKKDRKYQEELKEMGATVDGGGRANVPRPKNTNYSRFKDGGQVKGSKFKGTF